MHLKNMFAGAVGGTMVMLGLANPAKATFHEWRISEVFSNASGSVQFIEFQQPTFEFDDERFLGGNLLEDSALSHTYTFPANLPGAPAASSHFLVATPGYAALPGVPAPDYTLPINNFFNPAGDTLTFAFGVDNFTFGALPTDGTSSLSRTDWGSVTTTTGAATPTNFLGVTGAVPEPASLTLALTTLGLAVRRRR